MKLVEFENSTYGVRRWNWKSFWFEYYDFKAPHKQRWWIKDCDCFEYCKADRATAEAMLEQLTDRGTAE